MIDMLVKDLEKRVQEWISNDVSEDSKSNLQVILNGAMAGDQRAINYIKDAFAGELKFGTAGLRGLMGPGPNRMNAATVRRASWGLGKWALEKVTEYGAKWKPLVVIGFDARHNSYEFAKDTASVFAALSFDVKVFFSARPTPLLAFAVRYFNADVGVMITASHNSKKYNGYKVYLGGELMSAYNQINSIPEGVGVGSQIVPPFDELIAARIAGAPPACDIKLSPFKWDPTNIGIASDEDLETNNPKVSFVGVDTVEGVSPTMSITLFDSQYYRRAAKRGGKLNDETFLQPKIVTTAMHGVGGLDLLQALTTAGFDELNHVREQEFPNPDFPTLPLPNPEEPGALDLAFALAKEIDADLILANDPDADRLGVGVFDPHIEEWRVLTGDEVGAILGSYFIEKLIIKKPKPHQRKTIANSIVSSRLNEKLREVCYKHGSYIEHVYTLPGHKWISRVPELAFGYEEAIGYCCDPKNVRDKDGISAAVIVAKIAARAKYNGKSLIDILDDLAREHDLYLQRQLSVRLDSSELILGLVDKLRNNPPREIAGHEVVSVVDFNVNPPEPELKMNCVGVWLNDYTRILARPSGTEPKVKFYIETITPTPSDATFDDLTALRGAGQKQLDKIVQNLEEFSK
jgi:phosphomannomutase